jgi:Cu/Zn superoxide dismutase
VRKHLKSNQILFLACVVMSVGLLLMACATSQGTGSGTISIPGSEKGDPFSVTLTASPSVATPVNSTVLLNHAPTGTAMLTWSNATQALTVTVTASGLAPNSSHPLHMHQGTCAQGGAMLYTLSPLVTDATGNGSSTTIIPDDNNGIPTKVFFINLHNGPDLTSDIQNRVLACGDVTTEQTDAKKNETAQVMMSGTTSPDEHVAGQATLSLSGGKLHVVVHLSGLIPGSTHMAHIHAGTCAQQGPVAYPLNPVVADGHGNGTSTTTVSLVSFPSGHFYLNVHEAGTMTGKDSMATQQGFNPIACGDLKAA